MYVAGMHSIDNSVGYKNYLNASVKYLTTSLVAEIKKRHPDIDVATIDFNDPQWKPLIEELAYRPAMMGSMASSLGLDDKLLTEEIWNDLFNGWIKVEILPENSHLHAYAKETPKGMMVPLSNNPSKFDENNEYLYDGQRRSGNEALFTYGKGLSIWLIAKEIETPGTMKEVESIHQKVMEQYIIPEIERLSRIRTVTENGVTEAEGYESLVVSIMHIENRNISPHIHFHAEIINTAMSKDGRLYSQHADTIYENKAMLDALYMSASKRELEKKFNIDFEPVYLKKDLENPFLDKDEMNIASYDISTEIVPESLIEHYSNRIAEIEKSLKEKGILNTPNAREVEQKSTRDDKSELSPSELLAMWKEQFKELGYSTADLTNRVRPAPLNYIRITDRQLCKNFHRKHFDQAKQRQLGGMALQVEKTFGMEEWIDESEGLVQRKNKISRKFIGNKFEKKILSSFNTKIGKVDFRLHQFKAHVVKQALDTCSFDTAWSEADRIAEEQCELHIAKERYDYFKPFIEGLITDPKELRRMTFEFEREARFITKDITAMSNYCAETLMERVNEDRWLVSPEYVSEFIRKYEEEKGFLLSHDQVADIKATFSEKGAVICTAGMAGTGKSTSAEVKVRILESLGYTVYGTSVANTATKGLAKSCGMKKGQFHNATKLLKMLDEGKLKWTNKTFIIFDEAGMADLETYYRLIKHANKAGAKLNFVGEKEQLQPIGPSNGFKFLNENFVTMPLTSINRQKKDIDKENVKLWQSGEAEKALHEMYDRNQIILPKTNQDAFELVADLYVANPVADSEKIVMSALNGDNDIINNLIKAKYQQKGVLDAQTLQVKVMCSDGIEREFGMGDRITFFKNTVTDDGFAGHVDNSDPGRIKFIRKSLTGKVTALCLEMDKLDENGEKEVRYIDITKKRPHIRHGWSGTVHKAQGASKTSAYQVVSHADHNAFNQYVAGSRHKEDYTLIMSEEFRDKSFKKLQHKPITEKQNNKLVWLRDEMKIEIPDVAFENQGQARYFLKDFIDTQMPGAENKTSVLDDYSEIIKSFSTQNFKKNVADYIRIEDGISILKGIQKDRDTDLEMFRITRKDIKPVEKVETFYKNQSGGTIKSMRDIPSMHKKVVAKVEVPKVKKVVKKKVMVQGPSR